MERFGFGWVGFIGGFRGVLNWGLDGVAYGEICGRFVGEVEEYSGIIITGELGVWDGVVGEGVLVSLVVTFSISSLPVL